MFELKHLTPAGIGAALEKADQYRVLNQPWAAESICCDIVAIEPGNQRALRTLLLAQTDQFTSELGPAQLRAQHTLDRLTGDYERAYFAGIICERRATAELNQRRPGSRFMAWDDLRDAMAWYEQAEAIRPAGDDDAILRWNTCARLLNESPHITARELEVVDPVMGE